MGKKEIEEELLGPAVEEEPVYEEPVTKTEKTKKKEISIDNILSVLAETKEPTTVNAIRKQLGQPTNPELSPKIIWAADTIRKQINDLVTEGKVKNVSETRQGKYVLV